MNIDCRQLSSWKGRVNHVPKLQAQRALCNLVLLLYICAAQSLYYGIIAWSSVKNSTDHLIIDFELLKLDFYIKVV